ncbi:MAG: hypothetical protein QOE46_2814 [Acidobacteriota bacterium]|nr:hypothetical protein [Acidobacteriota bacterium]
MFESVLKSKLKKAELGKRGIEETRIVLMNGPARDWDSGRLELWAVPYGAALPNPFAADDEQAESEERDPEQ